MNSGKDICKQLKTIRQSIAEENGIPLEDHECGFKGECSGTCPHCEAEVAYLERELAHRGKLKGLGKAAMVAGAALTMAACSTQLQGDVPNPEYLEGEVENDSAFYESTTSDIPDSETGISDVEQLSDS